MCQCRFINCSKGKALRYRMSEEVPVGDRRYMGKSLYFLFSFAMHLKLLLKGLSKENTHYVLRTELSL